MRTLFFLLLFVNLAFATYIQLEPAGGSAAPPAWELQPEKIKLLQALPASATCLEWGTFVEADLERLAAAIAAHELDDKVTRQELGTAPVYWVHIPPLRSKRHAERKMGELKRLGITHYTRVDDTSKWNNAISMGFFENIEDAQAFLAALRKKGVRSAIIGARNLKQVKYVARSPEENMSAKMMRLKEEFPGSELKTAKCANT
ncbi:SPOR domain-containing protein [Nitrosospira sp. Nsp1]|uniref:SPOR domain-containing protein n=1 Tax=Nitrosospira sp. Nsp1 TaxID=136547 RepID=UPI00087F48F4|nr:SPOR domain-containing protein [Nitrosospira sp. Nsp1]SCX55025.1 Sporulation related domain-containing protein [Nitrosospira sp. Nsp1]